jgi:hypothetical protein
MPFLLREDACDVMCVELAVESRREGGEMQVK